MKKVTLILSFIFNISAFGNTFSNAVKNLEKHDAVVAIKEGSLSMTELAKGKGSWGDPRFKIAAKNFPKNSLNDNETPMTGIEIGVSQKLALSTKYGNMEKAYLQFSQVKKYESVGKKEALVRYLWMILIDSQKYHEEINTFKDSFGWINKILKVSKKLYENGKISQQALLDIQIRQSEIEIALNNKQSELKQQYAQLQYLIGNSNEIQRETIPWGILENKEGQVKDVKELSLQSSLLASEHLVKAKKLAYIPDVTVTLGYTKRSNIDNRGDFVSASLSFPLPFSDSTSSGHQKAAHDKAQAQRVLANYRLEKESQRLKLLIEIDKVSNELNILENKTIKFAENSRLITSKSYGLGGSTYLELLQSELKLQNLLLKRSSLNALLLKKRVSYKYLLGEKLYE
jgi:cobalt-zinc-cadmium efflux system outer membrane protein